MNQIYNLLTGPVLWLTFIIFIGGTLYKLISISLLAKKKDHFVYTYFSFKYTLRSIMHWIIPFGSTNMKKHPVMTIVAFSFHICSIILPLFLFAHVILIKESWDISWIFLNDTVADVMTLVVIFSCIFFFVRRIHVPEVKYLTTASDYVILAIVVAPFITGFWAHQQYPGYEIIGLLHILSGEIMLVCIPFTRLSHMIYAPLTRAYIGSEFGGVRKAIDW